MNTDNFASLYYPKQFDKYEFSGDVYKWDRRKTAMFAVGKRILIHRCGGPPSLS